MAAEAGRAAQLDLRGASQSPRVWEPAWYFSVPLPVLLEDLEGKGEQKLSLLTGK